MSDELLRVEGLTVEYKGRRGQRITALNDVSLSLQERETLGIMGESGSGKSTLGRAILGLAPVKTGRIAFAGEDVTAHSRRKRRELAGDLRAVFQDPYNSFNPSVKVGKSIVEGVREQSAGRKRMNHLLDEVGLPASAADRYPSAFSGGQRQRLAISRSLITSPRLVICDEAVSALDVSVQAQVLNLLRHFQQEFTLAYLFIGHHIDVVRYMSDRIAVLYRGHLVEVGPSETIARSPRHPYTRALIAATPGRHPMTETLQASHATAQGKPDDSSRGPAHANEQCPFAARCPLADEKCWAERPILVDTGDGASVACHRYSPAERIAGSLALAPGLAS